MHKVNPNPSAPPLESGAAPRRGLTRAALPLLAAGLLALAGCATGIEGPAGPLRAPTVQRVAASDGGLDLYFRANSAADSYTVYWSTSTPVRKATATKAVGVGKVFHHGGLTNGTVYYYLITAVKGAQESPDFAAISGMPVKESERDYPNFKAVIVQPADTFESLGEIYLKDRTRGGIIQDFNDLDELIPFQAVAIPKKDYAPGGMTASAYQMVPVLTYHQFSPDKANKMTVPFPQFQKEMQYLKDNGYHVVPLADFVAFMDMKKQLPEKSVVITIDDGWKSFYEYGYPVLKKFGYPSTLFVYTDFPESDPMALTWKQVKEMSKNGVDIQCHTKSHRNLRMQKGEDMSAYLNALDQEFSVCKRVLNDKVDVTPKFLAFPYGASNHLVLAMARKAGFQAAFTVQRGSNAFFFSDLQIRRSMIYGGHTTKDFENNLRASDDKVLK